MNSHKYLPKSILKRFEEKNQLSYFDFEKNTILKSTALEFNTEENYYTDNNEKNLSDNEESKIGIIINKLEKYYNNHRISEIELNENEQNIIKRYIAYQYIRDPSVIEIIKNGVNKETRTFLDRCKDNKFQNILISKEKKEKIFFSPIKDFEIVIRFNYSKYNYLVVSSTSATDSKDERYILINVTLTPKISITLCQKEIVPKSIEINEGYTYIEDDINSVCKYNIDMYNVAKKNFPHILVGYEKDLIKLLKEKDDWSIKNG